MDSGRSDDDPMRIYQVFQNSFNKIATKDTVYPPSTSATSTTTADNMDAGQFGQFTTSAASGQASTVTSAGENFGNPDSPYFPFGAQRQV